MQTIYIDGHFRQVGSPARVSVSSGGSSSISNEEFNALKDKVNKLLLSNSTSKIDSLPEVYEFLENYNNTLKLDEITKQEVDSLFD